MLAPLQRLTGRVPAHYASVVDDGPEACIVETNGPWSRHFLLWMATLDEPLEVLDPPELVDAARTVAERLSASVR